MTADSILTTLPRLYTERLLLREISPAIAATISIDPPPLSLRYNDLGDSFSESGAEPYSTHHLPPWGLFINSDDDAIGFCQLHAWHLRHASARLIFALAPAHRRKGYMAEALRAVLALGFGVMELNRMEAGCVPGNLAAANVLERMGMRQEALLRQYIRIDSIHHDIRLYTTLACEWPKR